MRWALLGPLSAVEGLSLKVLSMALADLLLGADPKRPLWVEAGAGMVAIDTLVQNWLARTGILRESGADHAYGPLCYAPGRCAGLITAVAHEINAQDFCPAGPAIFPRLIQHAIWQLCAEGELDICNGNQIDDLFACRQCRCPVSANCQRLPLQPMRYEAEPRPKTV